jgi:peptidoglycan hydrolase FlgJ
MTTASAADLGSSLSSMGNASLAGVQTEMKIKGKAKAAAQDFEAMFLNTMFQQMFTGIDGDGPFGGSGALKVWRSFLTDQYAKTFAKSGGIGIAPNVYSELLRQQGIDVNAASGNGTSGKVATGKGVRGKGAYGQ